MEPYRTGNEGETSGSLRDFHSLLFWLLLFPEFRSCSPCYWWNRGSGYGGASVVCLDKRMVEDFHSYGSHWRSGRRVSGILV